MSRFLPFPNNLNVGIDINLAFCFALSLPLIKWGYVRYSIPETKRWVIQASCVLTEVAVEPFMFSLSWLPYISNA
jgi:hypothetical protein